MKKIWMALLIVAPWNLAAAEADEAWKQEMERKINVLTQEVERYKLGPAAEPTYEKKAGLAPAASKIYGVSHGVSIGGYGEMVYQNFQSDKDDGTPSGAKDELDFLRAILYIGHKFTDKTLFNSEIEFEHASTSGGSSARGEVSVEFAYLEHSFSPAFGIRGGLLLIPMGWTNELHEPTLFHGAKRPTTESSIIPSTWRDNGAGIVGEIGPISYRSYLVAGLQASSTTSSGVGGLSSSGIRGGRTKGAKSVAEDFAWVSRLDFNGIPGTVIGASYYDGNAGQDVMTATGEELDVNVKLWDIHGMAEYRGLELKTLYARTKISDVAQLNVIQGRGATASTGEQQFGGYAEIAFDVLSLFGNKQYLAPFFRYERVDTQQKVPSGFRKNAANSKTEYTYGITYKPHPHTVIKADVQNINDQAGTGIDQVNAALGYMF